MGSAKTDSELLFEELCRVCGVEYERVAESTTEGERRPDFTIQLAGFTVVVETSSSTPARLTRTSLLRGRLS